MKTDSLYSRAMQFHALGYSVMPLRKDKTPYLITWKKLQTTAATEEQIEQWWKKWPDANIGIITGKISGITVIDLDVPPGATTTTTSVTQFPETFTVKTGNGGYQLYYKYQPGFTISARGYPQYPDLDMRSDTGYVVAPYSITDYFDKKRGRQAGGEYVIVNDMEPTPFPAHMFPAGKEKRKLSTKIGVREGGRNDSIASFAGQLLHSAPEKEWETEVWPAVERANKTYTPPLEQRELRAVFESIVKKELERRASLIISPIQLDDGKEISIRIRKNSNGIPYKDMANVLLVLSQHPYYKDAIRYNNFRQEIEYNGRPLEDRDITKIQYFMQTDGELHSISDRAVEAAIVHYAQMHSYDEAIDWLTSLQWDGKTRLKNWIATATGVEDDEYHAGIGAQWFMGMIRRIMEPGSTFDYVLLMVGGQGLGKTSFFRILGGPWYKSYTGQIDNKDFYLALRGAMIVDLDEGAALNKSDAIKIKSIITETHDEYRAPYGRVMKKYPRRFVFSMSTNDTEVFRDVTGNRRYWPIDIKEKVDFEWLTQNRDQLFAEAYVAWRDKLPTPEVPLDRALESQEAHLPEDAWSELVMNFLRKDSLYCKGDPDFFTTTLDVYQAIFPEEKSVIRLETRQAMRISTILKKSGGLEKKRIMVDGERANRWMFNPVRALELQERNLKTTRDPLEGEFD